MAHIKVENFDLLKQKSWYAKLFEQFWDQDLSFAL